MSACEGWAIVWVSCLSAQMLMWVNLPLYVSVFICVWVLICVYVCLYFGFVCVCVFHLPSCVIFTLSVCACVLSPGHYNIVHCPLIVCLYDYITRIKNSPTHTCMHTQIYIHEHFWTKCNHHSKTQSHTQLVFVFLCLEEPQGHVHSKH